MMNFLVDEKKCVNCGLCSSECPVLIISNKTDFPTIKEGKEDNCLKCQHCLAVCPEAAISIWGKNPEDSISASSPIPKSEELENLMQTRRSIRKFKKEELDKELIKRIASIALHAPTAQNDNVVQFTIVDNKDEMAKLRDLVYRTIQTKSDNDAMPKRYAYLSNFAKVWHEKQIDVIFRNAPHLVIASAPKDSTLPKIDSSIALTYFDLLANTYGIGTLWDGFAKYVFEDIAPELKEQIGIDKNHEVAMVLLFGKAAVKYARSIQNTNSNIKKVNL